MHTQKSLSYWSSCRPAHPPILCVQDSGDIITAPSKPCHNHSSVLLWTMSHSAAHKNEANNKQRCPPTPPAPQHQPSNTFRQLHLPPLIPKPPHSTSPLRQEGSLNYLNKKRGEKKQNSTQGPLSPPHCVYRPPSAIFPHPSPLRRHVWYIFYFSLHPAVRARGKQKWGRCVCVCG